MVGTQDMRKIAVQEGDHFGRWTVVREALSIRGPKRHFLCQCACGRTYVVRLASLRNGSSTQCKQCADAYGRRP